MFYSHSLGGDTSTITLPPRFIVIRYSLGGDTVTTAIRRGFAVYEYILVLDVLGLLLYYCIIVHMMFYCYIMMCVCRISIKITYVCMVTGQLNHVTNLKSTMSACGNVWKLLLRCIGVFSSSATLPNTYRTDINTINRHCFTATG